MLVKRKERKIIADVSEIERRYEKIKAEASMGIYIG